jgi:hypothetical protein
MMLLRFWAAFASFAFASSACADAGENELHGTIIGDSVPGGQMRIMVHSGRDRLCLGCAIGAYESYPVYRHVTSSGASTVLLYGLKDGIYSLEVCGSTHFDYRHVRLSITNGTISIGMNSSVQRRSLAGGAGGNDSLEFHAFARTRFGDSTSTTSLVRILTNPLDWLQVCLVVFLVGIPRLLGRLESIVLAEMKRNAPRMDDANIYLSRLLM